MLLTDFYDIQHMQPTGEGSWLITVGLHPEHEIYKGHFPGQAVVPGVCSLQIIKEAAEKILNSPLQYVQMSSCKFLHSLNPSIDRQLDLNLSIKDMEDGRIQILAEGTSGGVDFIKLKSQVVKK